MNSPLSHCDPVDTVSAIAIDTTRTSAVGDILRKLHDGARALGAECSCFTTFVAAGEEASYRFVVDCDPAWWQRYSDNGCMASDPWLAYARRHSEPTRACDLTALTCEEQTAVDLAREAGFVSALLVPAHASAHDGRVSLLTLGHRNPNRFDADDADVIRVLARAFALELHDWWGAYMRRTLREQAQLSAADLQLLELHCAGRSSKQIARELRMSGAAVNSRFQRLTARLGTRSRRDAARIAIDCGLIVR